MLEYLFWRAKRISGEGAASWAKTAIRCICNLFAFALFLSQELSVRLHLEPAADDFDLGTSVGSKILHPDRKVEAHLASAVVLSALGQYIVHGVRIVQVATSAELVPGLKVTYDKVAVRRYAPFVYLVDNRQELPRLSFSSNAAAPYSLEELQKD
jgi:hypothetical protein